jgi:glycosyltransferase involved in cell wall biosynthesis
LEQIALFLGFWPENVQGYVFRYDEHSMRILIVSFLFPPTDSVGAQRVGKTAKYLHRFGHDLRVLSARNAPYPQTAAIEIPEERLVQTSWWNVDAPYQGVMKRTSGIRKSFGRRPVQVADIKAGIVSPPTKPRWRLAPIIQRAYIDLVHMPDDAIGWYSTAVRTGEALMESFRPDVIYASSKPMTCLLVARTLSRKSGVPWIAELRDLWSDNHYYWNTNLRRRVDRVLERRTLKSASALVTVSEPLAETLRSKYSMPVETVLNGFDHEEFTATSAAVESKSDTIEILHTGSMLPQRDPTTFFNALGSLNEESRHFHVTFVGAMDERHMQFVLNAARKHGVLERLTFRPHVAHAECVQLQRSADLLLLLLWSEPEEKGVYTGKIFEYVGARRPIITTGYLDGVAAELIRNRNIGITVNDVEVLARRLRGWLNEKRTSGSIAATSPDGIDDLTREAQTRRIEALCARVATKTRSRVGGA